MLQAVPWRIGPNDAQLAKVAKDFCVYCAKVPGKTGKTADGYTMDRTAVSYCKTSSKIDVVSDPLIVENDRRVAADSSAWYWSERNINQHADVNNIKAVTRKINPALKDIGR